MGRYDVQQVCLNGHQIADRYLSRPAHRKAYCNQCGAATIFKCSKCGNEIPGDYIVDGVVCFGGTTEVPEFCVNCGEAFPWAIERQKVLSQTRDSESTSAIEVVEHICKKFHLVAKQLRVRYSDRETLDIKDEYDVQDLLHSLLRLFFDDIRSEEWTPSYAGSCSRVDFLLKNEQLVIEVKKTRSGLKARQVGEQLIIDKERYKTHPDCKSLICFVYDPDGYIANPQGLENDLASKDEEMRVVVIIVPKGY